MCYTLIIKFNLKDGGSKTHNFISIRSPYECWDMCYERADKYKSEGYDIATIELINYSSKNGYE